MLHVPIDIELETDLDPDLKSSLSQNFGQRHPHRRPEWMLSASRNKGRRDQLSLRLCLIELLWRGVESGSNLCS